MITHGSQLRVGGTYRFVDPSYAKDYGDWTITTMHGNLFYADCVNCTTYSGQKTRSNQGMVYADRPLPANLVVVEIGANEPDEIEAFFV